MKIIEEPTSLHLLWDHRDVDFTELMKVVVDIERNILAIDAEMHADLEEILLENGSEQKNLWGANVYFGKSGNDFIEYTSFINIRPNQDNRSMEILNKSVRNSVKDIILELLK